MIGVDVSSLLDAMLSETADEAALVMQIMSLATGDPLPFDINQLCQIYEVKDCEVTAASAVVKGVLHHMTLLHVAIAADFSDCAVALLALGVDPDIGERIDYFRRIGNVEHCSSGHVLSTIDHARERGLVSVVESIERRPKEAASSLVVARKALSPEGQRLVASPSPPASMARGASTPMSVSDSGSEGDDTKEPQA